MSKGRRQSCSEGVWTCYAELGLVEEGGWVDSNREFLAVVDTDALAAFAVVDTDALTADAFQFGLLLTLSLSLNGSLRDFTLEKRQPRRITRYRIILKIRMLQCLFSRDPLLRVHRQHPSQQINSIISNPFNLHRLDLPPDAPRPTLCLQLFHCFCHRFVNWVELT